MLEEKRPKPCRFGNVAQRLDYNTDDVFLHTAELLGNFQFTSPVDGNQQSGNKGSEHDFPKGANSHPISESPMITKKESRKDSPRPPRGGIRKN
ncbi:hypothetical protein CEXT_655871 [Caerostris extrusa]|uniref:Uncharacterized protein n=1 Tax=Caerostris extrusa TaxID=172846 RepID=A0AAV4NLP7_CAEEX|nr:hypothetical protein CEXT_655871 [Caerostris extrusa]